MKDYDYIILGAGASGLMLAYRMASDLFFDNKSILILDKDTDIGNDRTWSYWEEGLGEWDDIIYKTWDCVFFSDKSFSEIINISPYCYKMIRSETFYKKMWNKINTKSNVEFINTSVLNHKIVDNKVLVTTTLKSFSANKVFNSLPNTSYLKQDKYPVLQQHFIGWFIKTKVDTFDDTTATFMDFSVPQKGNTRFMYVLPMDNQTALF